MFVLDRPDAGLKGFASTPSDHRQGKVPLVMHVGTRLRGKRKTDDKDMK